MVTKASVNLDLRSIIGKSFAWNTRIFTTHGMGEGGRGGVDGRGGERRSGGRWGNVRV